MLDQNAILDANYVRHNPVQRQAVARVSSVQDDKVPFGHNRSRLIPKRRRNALNEIEQAIATRRDMSAMLDVVGRPITFSCFVVALIEERVESFKDKCFVFRFNRLTHLCSPSASVKFLSPIGTTCQTRVSEYLKWQPGSSVTTASTSAWAIVGAGLTWNRFGRTGARKCESFSTRLSAKTNLIAFSFDAGPQDGERPEADFAN